jgi:hypothetical protein
MLCSFDASCFAQPELNGFMRMGRKVWSAARSTIQKLLSVDETRLQSDGGVKLA